MKIGLTYDLRDEYLAMGFSDEETAEFDRRDTIDALDAAIRAAGHSTDRIGNIWSLTERLARGDRWDLVFNIAEGLYGLARESQVPALLDAYRIPYVFSDPIVLGVALHKAMAKRLIRDLGVATPAFHVVESLSDLDGVNLAFPLFAKPVAEGTSKGVSGKSKITSADELRSVCHDLLHEFRQPVLVEEFLPGREFTVGIVGTGDAAHALGVMEVILLEKAEKDVYSYENKEGWRDRVTYRLADDDVARRTAETALRAWIGLGCRDGGRVDMRVDRHGTPSFIEVNPLAGLNPEISDLPILCGLRGITYQSLIASILDSAIARTRTSSAASPKTSAP